MTKEQLIQYLKEYFDELIEDGKAIDYQDCLNQIQAEIH